MEKVVFAVLVLLMLTMTAYAQPKYDSTSLDPPSVQAGDDVNIYVKFHEGLTKREIYSTPMKNLEKLPVGEDPSVYYTARIFPNDEATVQYVLIKEGERNVGHLFAGETWTIPFKVHVSENALPTNYTLTFEVLKTTMDGGGEGEVVLYRDIQFDVTGTPKFALDSDSMLKAGEAKKFMISLANVGGGIARHATVNLNATSPLTVLGPSNVYIGDMNGLTATKIDYDLYVDSAALPKAYTIPIEIRYTDEDGVMQSVGKTVGVKVQGVPQVMASLDSFDDMKAGMTGKATVTVANKGFIEAKFLSIQMADTDQYTVVSKSNAYIGNLASDDFQSEDFKIKVKDGVEGKIPIRVTVTYTEENNNQVHTEDANLELNVMSAAEYDKTHPTGNGTQQIMNVAIAVPVLVVAYVCLWLLWKVIGAVTGFIDRKVFRRQ